ncbi:MAG: type II toxin-antitoxin system HicB family antitoxin [Actinomycetota bacterium]|nr:type II toxin-antitoxin system HicB family antitoxin [Actinomycetota bacterium]
MHGYVIVIERDEVGGHSAWSPDLPGCVSAGGSYDECVGNMHEAVQLHVDGLREDGCPVPEPSAVGALTIDAA